ncbi:hypothetical protein HGRIS_014331 [Hohenbuehelia grisea]|uniref:Uncharacterized protein n=1 Tax=Hohenbuehelia grisea TaxID=104357 RepID=A0ABR3JV09_9AGAR
MLCSFRACFMLVVLAALPMLTLAHGLASSDAHQFHAIEPKTNGARMAMGLPPLPPRRFAHTPGRRHGPTRIHARHAAPSPSPSAGFVRKAHNRIRVNRADSDVALGYVSKPDSNQAKGFGITTSQSSALQVRHHEDDGTISVVSPSRYPFIGFIADSSALDGDLRSGSATYVSMPSLCHNVNSLIVVISFLQLAETAHSE